MPEWLPLNLLLFLQAECVLELLDGLQNDALAGDVFLCLLEEVSRVRRELNKETSQWDSQESAFEASEYQFLLLQTVVTASERLGSAVLSQPNQVLKFIKSMLTEADAEAAQLSVALLVMILSGQVEIPRSDWGLLDELLPLLETLSNDPQSPAGDAAKHCRISIATRDKAWSAKAGSQEAEAASKGDVQMREIMKVYFCSLYSCMCFVSQLESYLGHSA